MNDELVTRPVLLLDLRGESVEAAEYRLFQTLRNLAGADDAKRTLVVDDAARLADHYPIYEAIHRSRMVNGVICVAAGPPASRREGQALCVPAALVGDDDVVTLWVGDRTGIGWRVGSGDAVRPASAVPGSGGRPGLDLLLEVLRSAPVFDQVLDAAGRVPAGAASPGIRVVIGEDDAGVLARAQQQAATAVVGGPGTTDWSAPAGPDDSGLEILLGRTAGLPAGLFRRIRPDTAIDGLQGGSIQRGQEARRLVDRMGSLPGLLSPRRPGRTVWQDVVSAGEAAQEYRSTVADLFERIDGREEVSQGQFDQLTEIGIACDPIRDTDGAAVAKRYRAKVEKGLDDGYGLGELATWLSEVGDRVAPAGSQPCLDRLEAACPPEASARLARPEPFRLPVPGVGLLAVVAACCLLASLGSFGVVAGSAVAVVWTVAAWLARARQPVAGGELGLIRALGPALGPHLLAAGLGVAGGLLLRSVVTVSPLAAVGGVVAGAVGLAAVLHRWWVRAVHGWRDSLGLANAAQAVTDLTALLCDVAVLEWVLSAVRRFAADAAKTMSGALRRVAESLLAEVAGAAAEQGIDVSPDAAAEVGPASARPAGAGPVGARWRAEGDVYAVVHADFVAAVGAMLAASWQKLGAGRLEEVSDGLPERVDAVLREYREHLELRGVHEAPAFVTASAPREALNQAPPYLADIRRAWSDDLMVQLCAGEDLSFLSGSAEETRVIRFAPRAAQTALASGRDEGLGNPGTAATVRLAAASRLAGALRLVPLRPAAVRTEVPVSGDTAGQL